MAWRARLFGWECVYAARAVAYHMRRQRPELARSVSAEINRHSVKNRFLMRIKNITLDVYARVLVPATLQDLLVLGAVVVGERQSLRGSHRRRAEPASRVAGAPRHPGATTARECRRLPIRASGA